MFGQAFKWMLLTLAVMLLAAAGCLYAWQRWGRSAEEAVVVLIAPASTPSPAPTPSQEPTASPTPTPTPVPEGYEEMVRTEELLKTLTIEEKIGQLLMFGLDGRDAPAQEFLSVVERYHVGNAILLGVNISTTDADGGFSRAASLCGQIAPLNARGIPFLISIDVEGGNVVRFRWDPWLASQKALGDADDPADAKARFRAIAEKLTANGMNYDLAPVADMAPDPMKSFMTTRIISGEPEVTVRIAGAIIEGLHEGGCMTCAKHFPGHGGTTGDSHQVTPTIRRTKEELEAYDLIAFRGAMDAGVDSVMVAHILYPELDPENIATVSPAILTGLLRGEMGYDGIVISDDFRMKGISTQMSGGEAALRFLLAGGDIILCGPDAERQEDICRTLLAAVKDGRLTETRIDESLRRVLHAKSLYGDWSGFRG